MSELDILMPLDGSPESARPVGCAVWLAERLGATLHVLHATARPFRPEEALERLGAGAAQRASTVLHQTPEEPVRAVLDAIARHGVKLVLMSARGASASAGVDPSGQLGRVATALLQETAVPIILMPLHYRESLPWQSMLVAASGEAAADQALATAMRLCARLKLRASVVHVGETQAAAGGLAAYADAPHYEYPLRLEEMVMRAMMGSPAEECRHVEEARVLHGDPATELLAELARQGTSVLALGCHGAFGASRAPVLKRLLERAEQPLLLVRSVTRSPLRLKVGDAICDSTRMR